MRTLQTLWTLHVDNADLAGIMDAGNANLTCIVDLAGNAILANLADIKDLIGNTDLTNNVDLTDIVYPINVMDLVGFVKNLMFSCKLTHTITSFYFYIKNMKH